MKDLFSDLDFKAKYHLAAINSINWARILAQIVYYVFAFLQTRKGPELADPELQISVPTGNFGDILAGYYALSLGIPIKVGFSLRFTLFLPIIKDVAGFSDAEIRGCHQQKRHIRQIFQDREV